VSAAVLEVADLKKHFPVKRGIIRRTIGQVYAVDGVSFEVHDAGARRRERVRQVDGGAHRAAAARADKRDDQAQRP
jgi:hypothetical protein